MHPNKKIQKSNRYYLEKKTVQNNKEIATKQSWKKKQEKTQQTDNFKKKKS